MDKSIAHVIITIKSEVSTFPIIIFFRGCVPEMFVTSYSVTYCIYVPGKPGICFHYYCAVHDECKESDTFCLADRTRSFVQYTISLSSLCKIIWRHWTYKMPVRYILSSVWVRLSIFSQLAIIQSIIQYVGLCVFSLPTPLVMIGRIYILCLIIIIKSEVWTITHCLGLGHETMVCAVCLSIFLWSDSQVIYTKLASHWLSLPRAGQYWCDAQTEMEPRKSKYNCDVIIKTSWRAQMDIRRPYSNYPQPWNMGSIWLILKGTVCS